MAAVLIIMRTLINHSMPTFLPGRKSILKMIRFSNWNRNSVFVKLEKNLNIQLSTLLIHTHNTEV